MDKRQREMQEPFDAYSVPEDRALWEAVESGEVKITWGPVPDIGDCVDELSEDVAFMGLEEGADNLSVLRRELGPQVGGGRDIALHKMNCRKNYCEKNLEQAKESGDESAIKKWLKEVKLINQSIDMHKQAKSYEKQNSLDTAWSIQTCT